MTGELRSDCPIAAALEVFGDRWSLLILRDIVFGDRRHFRQLEREMKERIAPNILVDRLRRLVDAGLLTRQDRGPGRTATYSLTEAGIRIVPVLVTVGGWGARYGGIPEEVQGPPQELEAAGPAHWEELMDELRARHLGQGVQRADARSTR